MVLRERDEDGPGDAEDEIVRRIHDAVIEQRLPPGTKLSEAALCTAFDAARARVRRSLVVLEGRQIVELHANRVDPDPNGWIVDWRYDETCDICGESCKRSIVRRFGHASHIGGCGCW